MSTTIYGLDLAKRVFQLYWVESNTGEVINRRFSRTGLIEFFSNRPATPWLLRHAEAPIGGRGS